MTPNGELSQSSTLDEGIFVGLDDWREAWEQHQDGAAVWTAIAYCIDRGSAFPPWILAYLRNLSDALPTDYVVGYTGVWKTLGFAGSVRKGRYTPVTDPDAINTAIWKMWARDHPDEASKDPIVVRPVAKYAREYAGQHGLDPEIVRRLFYRGRDRFRTVAVRGRVVD